MLKRVSILVIVLVILLSCAKKSTEYTVKHILEQEAAVQIVGNPLDLDIGDNRVYVAEDQGGLSIINLSNYNKQWINSFVSADSDVVSLIKIRKVSVISSLNRLFINETEGSDLIRIIDTTIPDSTKIIDNITGATQDIKDMRFQAITEAGSQFSFEGYFCAGRSVSYGKYGTHITGLPPFFTITRTYNSPASANGAFFTGQHVYVAAEQRGLVIFNRNDGSVLSSLDLPGEAQKVKVVGSYAYVPCRQDGLQIVNISNPAAPFKAGSVDTSGYATNVDVWNNYAVVSSGGGGIYLFDVTNPANPVLKDNITDCGYVNNVRFNNGKVLVASRDKGLLIYNINP